MKKVMIALGALLLSTLCVGGQTASDKQTTYKSDEVVINKKMIERFNDITYDENTVSFQQLKEKYTLEEMKLLYHAYHQSDLDYTDQVIIDQTIAEMKADVEDPNMSIQKIIPLYSNN